MIAEAHIRTAENTRAWLDTAVDVCEEAIAEIWADPNIREHLRPHLDTLYTISGDDIARLTRGPK